MALLRDFADILDTPAPAPVQKNGTRKPAVRRQSTPLGAPTEAHAKGVLATLRSRLEAQVATEDEYESAETRAIIADARYRLEQVISALARMDEGKYGRCVDCDGQINPDRLVIQPFATRCTSCQERYERKVRNMPAQR